MDLLPEVTARRNTSYVIFSSVIKYLRRIEDYMGMYKIGNVIPRIVKPSEDNVWRYGRETGVHNATSKRDAIACSGDEAIQVQRHVDLDDKSNSCSVLRSSSRRQS